MRSPGVFATLLVCLGVAGCTSTVAVDDLMPRPSMEITNAIQRPGAPVKATSASPRARLAANSARPAPGPAPLGEDEAQTVDAVLGPALDADADGGDEPRLEPVALVSPDKPAASLALRDPPAPRPAQAARAAAVANSFGDGVIRQRRFRDAKPINFGKASPKYLAVHGVDVSRWQGDIDWDKLRGQGANFVYIKATDGGDHLDPMFMKNWRNADAAGLKRGAYHFFYWCRTAGDQADWFIRNVPRVPGALPPVIDVEWNGESSCKVRLSRAKVLEKMQVFMDKLEAHYGQRPVIYTAPDFYRDNLKGAFLDYPFWLRAVAQHPSRVYPGRKWLFWQYSGSGLSHGVQGHIDLNVFNGSPSAWRAWAGTQTGQALVASE